MRKLRKTLIFHMIRLCENLRGYPFPSYKETNGSGQGVEENGNNEMDSAKE